MQPALLPPDSPQSLGLLDHPATAISTVGGILFLEAICLPVPGETVLLTAAIYAGAGRLDIYVVVVIGSIATFLGSFVGYLIGRTAAGRSLGATADTSD